MDIRDYRSKFSMIKSYAHVTKFVMDNQNMRTDWNGLAKKRFFVFELAEEERKAVKSIITTTTMAVPRVQVGKAMIIRSNSIN